MGWLDDAVQGVGDTLTKVANDPIGESLNFATNYLTYGVFGYDSQTGKFGAGALLHGAEEGVREVSGANRARAAATATREEIDAAKAEYDKRQADLQLQNYRADVAASRAAAAVRDTALVRTGAGASIYGPQSGGSKLGADNSSVLGA